MFDRLIYVDTLKSAGIPEDQARAHASALQIALTDSVATKDDVAFLRRDVEGVRKDVEGLRKDVDGLRKDMDGIKIDVGEIRTDLGTLRTDVDGLRKDVEGLRRDIDKCETMTNADRREAVLRGDMATIRAEMAGQKVELIRWMFGMMLAFSGIIITAMKYIR